MKRCRYFLFFFFVWTFLFAEEDIRKGPYEVDMIMIQYQIPHKKLPPVYDLMEVEVTFGVKDEYLISPEKGLPQESYALFEIGRDEDHLFMRSALSEITQSLLRYFNENGIHGIKVSVDPHEIDRQGIDLRDENNKTLTLPIAHTEVKQVRTLSKGKIPDGDEVDHERHARIKDHAPVQEGDLLAQQELDEYLYFLNRHPNRRIDLEVGSMEGFGLVGIDFLLTEDQPWKIYTSVSNTGPETLNKWQEVFGYINTQLTGHDDILTVDYATDSFDDFFSFDLSYSRPFSGYHRLRWNAEGEYRRFSSAQFAVSGNKPFKGDYYGISYGLDWNFWQKKDAFLDALFDMSYQYVHVDNRGLELRDNQDFYIPKGGLRFSRWRLASTLYLETFWSGTISTMTERNQRIGLGRFDVDKSWSIWTGSAYGSAYLEPLFGRGDFEHLAHEVFAFTSWQYAFGNRLIPEFESVLGGLYSVRGYPTATIAGDNSVTGVFEYRLHVPQLFGPKPKPKETRVFGKPFKVRPEYPGGQTDIDFILRGFFDIGAVSVNQSNNRFVPKDPQGTLMGTGFGGELVIKQNIFIRADFAWALKAVENPSVVNIPSGNFEFYFSGTLMY